MQVKRKNADSDEEVFNFEDLDETEKCSHFVPEFEDNENEQEGNCHLKLL